MKSFELIVRGGKIVRPDGEISADIGVARLCPHYLFLTESDVEKLGAIAKCAPPLRNAKTQDELWQQVLAENVTTTGSDHSPSPPEMKTDKNIFKIWGGISSAQHTLPLLLTEGFFNRGAALSLIAKLTSFNVAEPFHLPKTKGCLEIGADADFALVDSKQKFIVTKNDLFYRHKQSPYVGRALTGRVVQTILRYGRFLKTEKSSAKFKVN